MAILETPKRSVSASEVRGVIPAASRNASVSRGLLLFLISTFGYVATFAGTLAVSSLIAKVILSGANGIFISLLFVIGHDACHGSLTPSPRLNRVLGRLAFLPSLHLYSSWEYTHNTLHHTYTNVRTRDIVYVPFTLEEFKALPRWRQLLEKIYRSPLGLGLGFLYLFEIYFPHELFPTAARRARNKPAWIFQADRALVTVYFLSILAVIFLGSPHGGAELLLSLLLAFVVPYSIWTYLMGFVTFQHHTHPNVRWFADESDWNFFKGQVASTIHVEFPWIIDVILHNIMQHTAHHVDPRIPLYNLRESQRSLEDRYSAEIIHYRWSLKQFFETMRTCHLYDYQNHRWLDFRGNPTTV